MKKRFFALMMVGILILPARAQTAPPSDAELQTEMATAREEAKGSKKVAPETGFYWLLKAAEALDYGDKPVPLPPRQATPAQQLAYDRAFAAQQSEAIKLLRVALGREILRPVVDGQSFNTAFDSIWNYTSRFSQLASALSSESKVRAADGNFAGAFDSRLDCIHLGIVVSNGTLSDMMSGSICGGSICEGFGRSKIEPMVARLDAKTLRVGAQRLAQIESARPTFAAILQIEAARSLQSILGDVTHEETQKALATREGRKNAGWSEAEAREIQSLTPEKIRSNNARFYEPAIVAAKAPFGRSQSIRLPQNLDIFTMMAAPIIEKPNIRFLYERNVAENRLLCAALELRARKLENGVYPATFPAPIDPFSPLRRPLIGRKNGENFQLYSVGPNGKNDGGRLPGPRFSIDANTGIARQIANRRVFVDSSGDILAPMF